MPRGIEVDPDNRFQFLDEIRIVADFDRSRQKWLQAVLVPDAAHALLTDARRLGHRARAPVGRASGLFLRGLPGSCSDFIQNWLF